MAAGFFGFLGAGFFADFASRRFEIAMGHAFLDERRALGAGELLTVSADLAGLLLLLRGHGERRACRGEQGHERDEGEFTQHGYGSFRRS